MKEKIEALKTANEYMDNLKSGIKQAVLLIEDGQEGTGISLIPQIAEGIGWVINVMELTKDIQKEEIQIEEINEKLNEIVEALENDDYILIGDLFNYEILPIIENIHLSIRKALEN